MMPLIQSSADHLPFIDAASSDQSLHSANTLVEEELASADQTSLHPSIPTLQEPQFSDIIRSEHARLTAGQSMGARIDLSRYEALDAPARGDPEAWQATLQKAYASAEYLRGREINLGLLETYGKNAWLIGNSQLEDILSSLEREVEAMKLEQEAIEQARRSTQENVAGEMKGLEEAWRTGVGRMIETQAAAERLKQEILQRKKKMAAS